MSKVVLYRLLAGLMKYDHRSDGIRPRVRWCRTGSQYISDSQSVRNRLPVRCYQTQADSTNVEYQLITYHYAQHRSVTLIRTNNEALNFLLKAAFSSATSATSSATITHITHSLSRFSGRAEETSKSLLSLSGEKHLSKKNAKKDGKPKLFYYLYAKNNN